MLFGEQFHVDIMQPQDPWDTTVNVAQWVHSTEDNLRKIASVNAGKVLLQAVFDSGEFIAVEPLNFSVCNAHGAPARMVVKNKMYRGKVKFDSRVFAEGSHCFKARRASKENRGGHADEVLFHELIHALRGAIGVRKGGEELSGGLWRYNNVEEFYAVVLTNIYISDESNNGSSGLRAGHRGKLPLEKYFSRSLCFFASSTQVLPLLKDLRSQQKGLFDALAKVKAPFNPLHAMVKYPAAVERIANAKATREQERTAERHQRAVEKKRLDASKKAAAATTAEEHKQLEAAMAAVFNATPEDIAREAGTLAKEALGILSKW